MTKDEMILASYERGMSRSDIAKRYKVTGEQISLVLLKEGIPRQKEQRETRKARVRNVYKQLVQYKEEHDGNTFPMRKLAKLPGNHLEGVYVAINTLVQMGLVERGESGYGDIIIVGGKWIPPEEPNWEELL